MAELILKSQRKRKVCIGTELTGESKQQEASPLTDNFDLPLPFRSEGTAPIEHCQFHDKKWFGVGQKLRRAFEDEWSHFVSSSFGYARRGFAVIDGHRGSHSLGPNHVATYVKEHLFNELFSDLLTRAEIGKEKHVAKTISESICAFDREMYLLRDAIPLRYGCTFSGVVVLDDRGEVYPVNLGDSRTILFDHEFKIVYATKDDDYSCPTERDRALKAGTKITDGYAMAAEDPSNVCERKEYLNVSRALGNFDGFKGVKVYTGTQGVVSCVPTIGSRISRAKYPGGLYALMATDGAFDGPQDTFIFTNQTLLEKLKELKSIHSEWSLTQLVDELVGEVCTRTYSENADDVTILLARLW